MDSVLRDLWRGQVRPRENLTPNTPEFRELNKLLTDEAAYLKSVLSPSDWERFGRHEETGDMISEMLHEEAFIRGFRFAAQIMVAVYGSNDSLPELLKLFGLDSPGGK